MYYVVCITSALYHGNNAWFKKELLLSNCYALSSLPFLYHDHFWTPFNPKCNRVIRNMAERVSGKNRMEDDFTRKNKSEIRNKMFLQKTLYFFVLSFDRQLCFCYNDWYFLIELTILRYRLFEFYFFQSQRLYSTIHVEFFSWSIVLI